VELNDNIKSITGNPKKAINKLAYPMILSMLLLFTNNLIDSMWVVGLGSDVLAALGFISPLYVVIIGIGSGIGAGTNSLISRFIGKEDYESGNNVVFHSLIITFAMSVFIALIGLFFLKDILLIIGANSVLDYALKYGMIIFLSNFVFLFVTDIASILRAEGDSKRATIPLIINSLLNMILDPIFIYVFNWGVEGAAIATVLSNLLGLVLMLYWILIKKDTFFTIKFKNYVRSSDIYKEIILVSLPASIEEVIFALVSIILNYLIIITAGTTEVAVFTIVWRFISFGILPAISIGVATITVSGIAYGARSYENLKTTISYSALLSFVITLSVCLLFFIFSYQISYIFNFASGSPDLIIRTSEVLKTMSFYILFIPFGATAAYVYQGIGRGFTSLLITFLRELLLSILFAYIFAIPLKMGIFGVYFGATLGITLGSLIGFSCILVFLKRFKRLATS